MSFRITIDEIDVATADAFRAQVDQATVGVQETGGVAVLDFTDVTFFGSTGVVILSKAQAGLPPGCRIRIVNAAPVVVRVLEVTGLTEFLDDP